MLGPYLSDHWNSFLRDSGFDGPDAREDTYPADEPLTVVTPDALGEFLDTTHVERAILHCAYRVQSILNEDLAAALATAANRWLTEVWLDLDSRLRASIVVPSQNPHRAAREIDRFGDHPGVVQVTLPVRSDVPYGSERFRPVLEAASRHGLTLGIQAGGSPGIPTTPAGWTGTVMEDLVVQPLAFQAQLTSLAFGGAFRRLPELRIALIGSGYSWLPAWLWRADKDWRSLQAETPWVTHRPSDTIRERMWIAVGSHDLPPDAPEVLECIAQIESDDVLMFGSGHPRPAPAPLDVVPPRMNDRQRAAFRFGNARACYRL